MPARELWGQFKESLFDEAEQGLRLDLSRMDLPDGFFESHAAVIGRAFDAMEELERGAVANPDEGRMVGHYWLRAPELAPTGELRQAILDTLERVKDFSRRVHSGEIRPTNAPRFRSFLVVGIGGSALGPQFVADALGTTSDLLTPHFLDNTDADGIDRVLAGLGQVLGETLTIVISKSGTTPETRNGMVETGSAYRARGLELGRHAVAVTQVGRARARLAVAHGSRALSPMWDWVGGRTSETSAVGLLPAALQGIDVDALLEGAAAMDRATRRREVKVNPAALLALAWYHAGEGRGSRDMVVLPYKDRLALFSRYLQQLVMESLGKERDLDGRVVHQGLAVYGNKGSTDQHAYVQQLREGISNFFVTFIRVLRDREGTSREVEPGVTSGDYLDGFYLGTRSALHENGRMSLTLTLDDVSPRSVGGLIALYERAVGLYARLIHVNAYHQPGVEAGKKAAAAVLSLQQRILHALVARGPLGATCGDLASDAGAPNEVETAYHILERLARNPGRGVTRTEGDTPFEARYTITGVGH